LPNKARRWLVGENSGCWLARSGKCYMTTERMLARAKLNAVSDSRFRMNKAEDTFRDISNKSSKNF
ncbi:hypothetical protein KIN20_007909, partial [Parelaphostrongylus tenuis]